MSIGVGRQQCMHNTQRGVSIVEIIVATGMVMLVIVSSFYALRTAVSASDEVIRSIQVSFLLQESVEAIKSIRDNDWSEITTPVSGNDYSADFSTSTNTWTLSVASSTTGIFAQTVVFSDVYRDANDDIALSGTLDSGTRKVDVTISWPDHGYTASSSISFYITDLFN